MNRDRKFTAQLNRWITAAALAALALPGLLNPPAAPVQAQSTTPTPHRIYLPVVQDNCTQSPPPAPAPNQPADQSIFLTTESVSLTWTPDTACLSGQIHFALQIATDPNFTPESLAVTAGQQPGQSGGVPYTAIFYTFSNPPAGVYYWRVAAWHNNSAGPWSQTRRFFVVSAPAAQLLGNPSFEADPADILPWQWSSTAISSAVRSGGAPHGQRFLAANRQNGDFADKSLWQTIAAPQVGQTYNFAVWVRTSSAAAAAGKPRTGRVELLAGGGASNEHSLQNFQVSDTGWRCVETWLTVKQAGHTGLQARVALTSLDALDTELDFAVLRSDGQTTCPPGASPATGSGVLVSHQQGFDTCAAPDVSQLAAWQASAPYKYVGIYLGGVSHYAPCASYNQQHQTPAWLDSVAAQGWQFIPTWVGPQAPCTSFTHRHSLDPAAARAEGAAEAQQAMTAAANLGLISGSRLQTIIYYDMENYNTADAACRGAVNAFLEGWSSELQNSGQLAGVYGTAATGNDWYTLNHVPDSTWLAWYNGRASYIPTMTVQAVNQAWVAEPYWPNHRLFQYSGSHTETWGGASINVDSNAAAGLVAVAAAQTSAPAVQQMHLLTPTGGWLLAGGRLFRTADGGDSWQNISPPQAGALAQAAFVDAQRGWAAEVSGRGQVLVWRTQNGGASWDSGELPLPAGQPVSELWLDFWDAETGAVSVKFAGGSNFSRGLLFKTGDGGASWSPANLPAAGPVRFVTPEFGWLAGGPLHGDLYVTRNGGFSWQAQPVAASGSGLAVAQLPLFANENDGALAVTRHRPGGSWVEMYATADGGQTWHVQQNVSLAQNLAPGAAAPVGIVTPRQWLVADTNTLPGIPAHPARLSLASPVAGWLLTQNNGRSQLFRTTTGGQTWTEIALPR